MKKTSAKSRARVYGGATAAVRKASRQKAFVEAACTLIGVNGFKSLTVRSICKEAGLTDRYFYESFGSTEDLLIAVYQDVSRELEEELTKAYQEAGKSLKEQLSAVLYAYFRYMRDPRKLRIITAEVLGVSDKVTACYMQGVENFARLFHTIALADGREVEKSPENVALFGQMLLGSLTFAVVGWCESGYSQPTAEIAAFASESLLTSIEAFYRPV